MRYIVVFFIALVIMLIYTYAYAEEKTWEYSLCPKVYCEQRVQFVYDERPHTKIITVCFTTYPEEPEPKKPAPKARRKNG